MIESLRLFYSCLVLVAALHPQLPQTQSIDASFTGWCRFLNDLCWLCDTDTGGKTVVALGVEQLVNSLRLWVSSNDDPRAPTKLLRRILGMLREAQLATREEGEDIKANLLSKSIQWSHKKVKLYTRRLEFALERVETLQNDTSE